jgi:hypothetical protein
MCGWRIVAEEAGCDVSFQINRDIEESKSPDLALEFASKRHATLERALQMTDPVRCSTIKRPSILFYGGYCDC